MVKNGQGEEPVFSQPGAELFHRTGRICITTNTIHSLSSQIKNVLFSIQEQCGIEQGAEEQSSVSKQELTGCTRTLFLPYRRVALEFWCRDST